MGVAKLCAFKFFNPVQACPGLVVVSPGNLLPDKPTRPHTGIVSGLKVSYKYMLKLKMN